MSTRPRVRLRSAPVTPEIRRAHDRHQPRVILGVLAVLLVYVWCYTQLAAWYGLPTPGDVVGLLGFDWPHVIDFYGSIDAKLEVTHAGIYTDSFERLIFFVGLFGCFLSVYFAPLQYKAWMIVVWFVALFAVLFGIQATGLLLAAHLTIYLAFHPTARHSGLVAALWGGLVAAIIGGMSLGTTTLGLVAAGSLAARWVHRRLLPALVREERTVQILRTVLIQASMILILGSCVREGLTDQTWTMPVGLLYFCYQWARLMVYRADYRDGVVPRDLPLGEYLAVFLSPVAIPNFSYAPYLGQGYGYLKERHLVEDKNALVRSGIRLWCLALVYMVFAGQFIAVFVEAMDRCCSLKVYAFTSHLVREHVAGVEHSTPTVLISTFLDQARVYLIYGGVTHFRVGAWRILGYRVDTQYDRPWLATNLASLWGRFAFHLREFLVRVFYYPTFFAYFKRRPALRIFFATMAATMIGNLLWGHVPPATLDDLTWGSLLWILSTWPYFLILGLGISITQIVLTRCPRTRRPWTWDRRFPLDILSAYLTFQFFALIHVFIRPQEGGSLWSYTRLFLRGFGISLE